MRILITGASGFIGRRVVAALAGHDLIKVSRTRRVGYFYADLHDEAQTHALLEAHRPQIIIHLAWEVGHGSFWTSPDNLTWRAATLSLAKAARNAGVQRFIGSGTCAEYDWSDGGKRARREDDALKPTTLYGQAKADTFLELTQLFDKSNTSFAWARLFHLFGSDEPPTKLVRGLAEAAKQGRVLPLKAPAALRDYMNVEAAGEAIAALSLSAVTGAVNIATGQGQPLKQIGALIAEVLGHQGLYDSLSETETGVETPAMVANISRLLPLYNPNQGVLTPDWIKKHFTS